MESEVLFFSLLAAVFVIGWTVLGLMGTGGIDRPVAQPASADEPDEVLAQR